MQPSSPEVEVHRSDMHLLWHHDAAHDGVDEEGEQHVAQEDQHSHQRSDEDLLDGLHRLAVVA